ncbi:hypothetical protein CVT24_010219 [Panaeolus cyanescens]|uniref:Signal peptidase complex subunit 1 n=1 Tax=Panaeolus cyanescens TaxID=181874 RepID=A0A409YPU9_9AGAR|nr:hypothetical protein CVT24_010219 [Panaeolus cyanescens]
MSSFLQEIPEGKIDFVAQDNVDFFAKLGLAMVTFTGFVFGIIFQDLRVSFGILGGGTVILALLLLPPWPMHNSHPVKWLPVKKEKES